MSLEHSPAKQRRRARTPPTLPRIGYSVGEWVQMTGFSRPTVYRQMQKGTLRYIEVDGIRRIPASEKARQGFEVA